MLVLLASYLFWWNAWISDDAMITFRVVEQLHAGHGPRWNPHERVQVFTHPLWFWLLAAARLATSDLYRAALGLSFVLTLGVLLLTARAAWTDTRRLGSAALAVILLLSSKAFVDFSGAGLENPLTALLLAGLLLVDEPEASPRDTAMTRRRDLVFFLLVGLLGTTRLDLLLVAAPAALLRLRSSARRTGAAGAVGRAAAGLLPLVLWSAFALVYYGSPFPNTALAKLATGIPATDLARQGVRYVGALARWDPLTLALIVGGTVGLARRRTGTTWATGCALYLVYVVWIGGDFMVGRLFQPLTPLFALGVAGALATRGTAVVLSAALLSSLALPRGPLRFALGAPSFEAADEEPFLSGIADEKTYYFDGRSWLHPEALDPPTSRPALEPVERWGTIGWSGYTAPLETILVDEMGLADPLLVRMPLDGAWRIGHFRRQVPAGYVATLVHGDDRFVDPQVSALYRRIALVSQGPLTSPARWREIVSLLIERPSLVDAHLARYELSVLPARPAPQMLDGESGGRITGRLRRGTVLVLDGWLAVRAQEPGLRIEAYPIASPTASRVDEPVVDPDGRARFRVVLEFASEHDAIAAERCPLAVKTATRRLARLAEPKDAAAGG